MTKNDYFSLQMDILTKGNVFEFKSVMDELMVYHIRNETPPSHVMAAAIQVFVRVAEKGAMVRAMEEIIRFPEDPR